MMKTIYLLLVLTLTGCSSSLVKTINSDTENEHAKMQGIIERAGQGKPLQQASSIERMEGLWLPTRKLPASVAKAPVNQLLTKTITINRTFVSIQEVAERITGLTGIPVIVSSEALLPLSKDASSATAGSSPIVPSISSTNGMPSSGMPNQIISLAYTGALAGFLDMAAARYGIYWEWNDNKVRLFRTATQTFRLVALPGDTTLNAKISNQSGGASGTASSVGSSNSSSSQETGVSFSGLSVWKGIEDSIQTMLTASGKMVVTPATGTVTVTDTPQVLSRVEKFIDQQNESLGRQVVVNVRVLSVDLSNSDNYGINWNVVYNSLSQNFGLTLKNSTAPAIGASSLALKILSTAGSTGADIKSWAGSEAIINALSKQGRVSQVTSASVTTLNNQPAPMQVGRQTSYLASSTTTIGTAGAPSTTTLQPGLITTGFSMNLVPHMLDDKRLLLQYAMDLSSLLNLSTVSSGDSSIQTPEIETRNFLQRVMLNSGDTLVVTGFEQSSLTGNMQGVGDAGNTALGGNVNGSKNKTILVILIQPVIAD